MPMGAQISKTGGCEKEIRRTPMGKTAVLNYRSYQQKNTNKMLIIRMLIIPIVAYLAESWTTRTAERRGMDVFEMYIARETCEHHG